MTAAVKLQVHRAKAITKPHGNGAATRPSSDRIPPKIVE